MLLTVEKLSTGYGRGLQLDDLNFTVPAGQSLAIVGVNGAGKTTLLKCLLGLHAPRSGRVLLNGEDPAASRTRRQFAYLPEKFAPPPLLTGFEIMNQARLSYGLGFNKAAAGLAAIRLGLPPDLLNRKVRTYSKGNLQKLGLASALYSERRILILDEPFSGLDPVARLALEHILQGFRAEGGCLIFTSHLLAGLERLCDQIVMLQAGRLAFSGTPADMAAQQPAGTLQAAFLGLAGTP